MIDALTKLCCVIGHPVAQSLSPIMHNKAYESLKLNYAFLAFDVLDLKNCITAVRTLNIKGVSVTIPYKKEVMKYLDNIDDTAKEIGAVNTIVNIDGSLTGLNTDWIGAVSALKEKKEIKDKNIAIIGNGGAASAISYAVKKEGGKGEIIDRKRGENEIEILKNADIIINATPVGMSPNDSESPIPDNILKKSQTVFDIVFKPHETKLLKEAKEQGATVVYGYKMLLYGAARQFKLFTGVDAPIDIMQREIEKYIR